MVCSAGLVMVIMGISGSGKSTIGNLLANSLGCFFLDADDFHSEENKEKMRQGIALTESDRLPWLETLRDTLIDYILWGKMVVLACSALKPSYRHILRTADFEWALKMHEKEEGNSVSTEQTERGEFVSKEHLDQADFDSKDCTNQGSDENFLLKTRTESTSEMSKESSSQLQKESGCPETSENWSRRVQFFLLNGPKELFASRLEHRYEEGAHFMPPSLLQSQIDSLEISKNEMDIICLDASMSPEAIVEHIKERVCHKVQVLTD